MTLTSGERVRLKIQDLPTRMDRQVLGDGTAVTFPLPNRNLTSGTAYVPSPAGWATTAATFNTSGLVTLTDRVSAGSALRFVYVCSTFSDAEVDQFIEDGQTVRGAAKEALESLMFDGLRRASWAAPDGSEYDDTAALKHLIDLYDRLNAEIKDDDQQAATAGGSADSWSLTQGNY